MSPKQTEEHDPPMKKEVKEFGNGGHITLPGEYVGETVQITMPEQPDERPKQIQPPITTDKIRLVLEAATRSDFKRIHRDCDSFPRECRFQYKEDIRLTIDVDLVHEGSEHPYHERGTVVYFIWDPTEEELDEHASWFDKDEDEYTWELAFGKDPSVKDVLDHPITVYNDLYKYSIKWNGSTVYTTEMNNRQAKNGRFYYPRWSRYSSLSEYRSSTAYRLATAISEAPKEDYDQYLEALQLEETVWGDKNTPLDFDRENVLKKASLFHP